MAALVGHTQDQLLLFKRHLYPKVFQRLVLKVWETVAFCMWNWLVPERPRHNYITERYMKVRLGAPQARHPVRHPRRCPVPTRDAAWRHPSHTDAPFHR